MTYFNPLIAPLAGSPQAQRTAAADKERQAARGQALAKNSAAEGDRYEHEVESPEGLSPVGDNPSQGGNPNPRQPAPKKPATPAPDAAGETHIDVTG